MKYEIQVDEEFLRVTMSGRESDEPPSHVCKAVLAASQQLKRPRILIELDQKAPLSPVSQYQLVSRLPDIGFNGEHRIANGFAFESAGDKTSQPAIVGIGGHLFARDAAGL